jgi:hypothetical protein
VGVSIRTLLEHVGLDLQGKDIEVSGHLVDLSPHGRCFHDHDHLGPCLAPDHRTCGPVVARIRTAAGNWIRLCRTDLDAWFDAADSGDLEEPAAIRWTESH